MVEKTAMVLSKVKVPTVPLLKMTSAFREKLLYDSYKSNLVQDCVFTRSSEFCWEFREKTWPSQVRQVRSSEKGPGLTLVPKVRSSEKGMGRTLVRQVWSSEKGMGWTLVRQVRCLEKRQGQTLVWQVWSWEKGMGWTLVWQVRSLEKRKGSTQIRSFGSEFRKMYGPNPGSAGSEFGERTWPNPDSEFGFGVLKKEWAEPWFGRFGVWRKNLFFPFSSMFFLFFFYSFLIFFFLFFLFFLFSFF